MRRAITQHQVRRRERWAVLSLATEGAPIWLLAAVGNGSEFQYPIFHSRAEARLWAKRRATWPTKIVRCTVSFRG